MSEKNEAKETKKAATAPNEVESFLSINSIIDMQIVLSGYCCFAILFVPFHFMLCVCVRESWLKITYYFYFIFYIPGYCYIGSCVEHELKRMVNNVSMCILCMNLYTQFIYFNSIRLWIFPYSWYPNRCAAARVHFSLSLSVAFRFRTWHFYLCIAFFLLRWIWLRRVTECVFRDIVQAKKRNNEAQNMQWHYQKNIFLVRWLLFFPILLVSFFYYCAQISTIVNRNWYFK